MSESVTIDLKKDEVLWKAGSDQLDLYLIHSGRLLVCITDGTKLTPLAYLEEGEYIGELSFFDNMPRSAHIICTEDASLIKIPVGALDKQLPNWMIKVARSMTTQIRHIDELVSKKGFRSKKGDTIAPLSIDEQRHYNQLLDDFVGS